MSLPFQLSPRESIIQCLNNFARGLDDGNPEALASVFTHDTFVDLTPFNVLGFKIPLHHSRDAVVSALMKSVGKVMDSLHQLTNFTVEASAEGDVLVECYALAQHWRLGEGNDNDKHECYLMGNKYNAQMVQVDGAWKVRQLRIEPRWVQGNFNIMKIPA